MSRASEASLADLHRRIAETLLAELTEPRYVVDKQGKAWPAPASPALLAQAIKFLKDNGVDAPAKEGSRLAQIASELANIPDDQFYSG
jgi:hypothetical protein